MKPLSHLFYRHRSLGAIALASMYFCTAPGVRAADDDHDKHEHDKHAAVKHEEHAKEHAHAVEHAEVHHAIEEHHAAELHKAAEVHHAEIRGAEIRKDIRHADVERHIAHAEAVRHRHHAHWTMHLANGWRGHGYYYGPPNVDFYAQGPDVEYFASRDEVPQSYWQEDVEAPDAPEPVAGPTPQAESPVAAVQQALASRGYYSGAVDGSIGPVSSRAIARYQADNNLEVTGNITQSLLQSLGID